MTEYDLDGREIDPIWHDCKYKGTSNAYKVCGMCIYRFTCKYIRYNLLPPIKLEIKPEIKIEIEELKKKNDKILQEHHKIFTELFELRKKAMDNG